MNQKIGFGTTAWVYTCSDLYKHVDGLVLKVSRFSNKSKASSNDIEKEFHVYSRIFKIGGSSARRTFSKIHWYGTINSNVGIIMERHGQHLGQYISQKGRFSTRDAILISLSILSDLELLHTKAKVFHGDIDEGNILIGLPHQEKWFYLVDFGRAGYYSPHCSSPRQHLRTSPYSEFQTDLLGLARLLEHLVLPDLFVGIEIPEEIFQFQRQARTPRQDSDIDYNLYRSILEKFAQRIGANLSEKPDCFE